MSPNGANGSTVATVARSFDILEVLEDNTGWNITELAAALSLPKSSVHRHLKTLEKTGFVVQEGNEYYLGLRFLGYGVLARRRHDPQSAIKEGIQYAAEQTNERAQFMVWEHGTVIYLYRELGERAVQTGTMVGKRMPIHATSGGKSMLAHLPEATRDAFLDDHDLTAYTEHTITDPEKLRENLTTIQESGYSINDQEYIEGLRAVSVPLQTAGDEVIGSIGVSGPTYRLQDEQLEQRLPDLLLGIANEIELRHVHQSVSGQ